MCAKKLTGEFCIYDERKKTSNDLEVMLTGQRVAVVCRRACYRPERCHQKELNPELDYFEEE